jgi:hypothetical protein
VLVVEAFVNIVGLRSRAGGDVHHIPKLAMERYIYLAGLVNDNAGVTYYEIHLLGVEIRERSHQRLVGIHLSLYTYRRCVFGLDICRGGFARCCIWKV